MKKKCWDRRKRHDRCIMETLYVEKKETETPIHFFPIKLGVWSSLVKICGLSLSLVKEQRKRQTNIFAFQSSYTCKVYCNTSVIMGCILDTLPRYFYGTNIWQCNNFYFHVWKMLAKDSYYQNYRKEIMQQNHEKKRKTFLQSPKIATIFFMQRFPLLLKNLTLLKYIACYIEGDSRFLKDLHIFLRD